MSHLEPGNIKLYGIVLRNSIAGNGSRLVTLLDREFGKIDIMAFGSSREKSSRRSCLLVFNVISGEASRRQPDQLYSLKEATLVRDFPGITSDLSRLAYLYLVAEVLNSALPKGSSFNLFNSLLETIELMEISGDSGKYALGFIIQLLSSEGMLPDLQSEEGIRLGNGSARFVRDVLSQNNVRFLHEKNIAPSVTAELISFIRSLIKEQTGKDLSSPELIRLYR